MEWRFGVCFWRFFFLFLKVWENCSNSFTNSKYTHKSFRFVNGRLPHSGRHRKKKLYVNRWCKWTITFTNIQFIAENHFEIFYWETLFFNYTCFISISFYFFCYVFLYYSSIFDLIIALKLLNSIHLDLLLEQWNGCIHCM